MIKYIKLIMLLMIPVFLCLPVSAQDQAVRTVSGTINNEFGEVVPGVVITSEDGQNVAVSDKDGTYILNVNGKSRFVTYVFKGYKTEKVKLSENSPAQKEDVRLHYDNYKQYETVNLGFTAYPRWKLAGAVAAVEGTELAKSPVANLASTFAGRFPGLITNENGAEWARVNNSFYVRGAATNDLRSPVLVIDGFLVPTSPNQSLDYISPSEIESITVLKDPSVLALYGIKGAEGAIVITTKRGKAGELKITGNVDVSTQEFTTRPYTVNALEYVTLRNQAAYNTAPNHAKGMYQIYSKYVVDKFAAGDDRAHYPDNNWYDMNLKRFAHMQRAGINLSGGSDKVNFFSNVNFMNQNTNFKTVKQDKYDPDPNFQWANFRTNVDAKLTKAFRAYLNVAGNVKREKTTETSQVNPYQGIFDLSPIVLGPLTTEGTLQNTTNPVPVGENITTASAGSSVYGRINSQGYIQHTVTNIYSNFGLELDLSSVVPGLKASGSVGFQSNTVNSLSTTREYVRYERILQASEGQITTLDDLIFKLKGNSANAPLKLSKSAGNYYNMNYRGNLNYQKNFGKHEVNGMAYGMFQDVMNGDPLTYKRVYAGIEANYAYDKRYVVTLNSGYSGSDQFARDRRFHFTPAVAAAWIVSNENFMKAIPAIDLLKIKGSYGKNGNDDTGMERYGYLDKITGVTENKIGNPLYEPEMTRKLNYGIEIGMFNGLRLSADFFKSNTDNLLISATDLIPSYQGLVSSFPLVNAGKTENRGYEVELGYNKQITRDLAINIGGYVAYNKNKISKISETRRASDYIYQKRTQGFPVGQAFGYLIDYSNGNGFFNSQAEIDEWRTAGNKYSFNNNSVKMGDLKYQDLNGDQLVDDKDRVPLGTGSIPQYTFGMTAGFKYKAFDLTALFQGRAKYMTLTNGSVGIDENFFADQQFSRVHLTAWTAERYANGEEITFPALSRNGTNVNKESSDFFLVDRSYIRLRNLELGYTLPGSVARAISASKIRFTLAGHNLLTWDRLKTKDYGPEGTYSTVPVARVYNIGLNVQF